METIIDILKSPESNGFAIFILGVLFVLSVYHFILYFQHKDRVYLFYSLYTALIFVNHLNDVSTGFITALTAPFIDFLNFYNAPLMWLYNSIYFIFGFSFLNLKSYSKKWYFFIIGIVAILVAIIAITTLLAGVTNDIGYIEAVGTYFVPFLLIFGIGAYYLLFTVKMPLREYIIVGSFVLYVSSLLAYYSHAIDLIPYDSNIDFSIFYIGVVIENIIFSLGLGHKQKMILQDKNSSQQDLIAQLKENEKLKDTIQKQLEKNVDILSKKAADVKLEQLKTEYDKELLELKIASLRSQMNPHFIFNSLNAIKLYIIDNKKENAVYYLNKFSKLIRRMLAATREKEITLLEEIETIKLYTDIENIRFNNEIEFIFTIEEKLNLETVKMPSLILQPFVENAIWHGLSLKEESKELRIDITKKGDTHIIIKIKDNGIGREKSTQIKQKKLYNKDSIGINLTKERLSNFEKDYENTYDLMFNDLYDENKNSAGTEVILKIPVK